MRFSSHHIDKIAEYFRLNLSQLNIEYNFQHGQHLLLEKFKCLTYKRRIINVKRKPDT